MCVYVYSSTDPNSLRDVKLIERYARCVPISNNYGSIVNSGTYPRIISADPRAKIIDQGVYTPRTRSRVVGRTKRGTRPLEHGHWFKKMTISRHVVNAEWEEQNSTRPHFQVHSIVTILPSATIYRKERPCELYIIDERTRVRTYGPECLMADKSSLLENWKTCDSSARAQTWRIFLSHRS